VYIAICEFCKALANPYSHPKTLFLCSDTIHESLQISYLCLLDIGVPRTLNFPFCSCFSDTIELIKLGYWPGTPVTPHVAFTFEFMELLESLLLECHVAVQDFTQAWTYLIAKKLIELCLIHNPRTCLNVIFLNCSESSIL